MRELIIAKEIDNYVTIFIKEGIKTMKEIINTKNAPAAIGPYSQGITVNNMTFYSGQIAIDPTVGKIVATNIEDQTRQILKNISALLAKGGYKVTDVVKTTVFITNIADFGKVNAIYGEFFNTNPPARSCVEVSNLPAGALIEIEIIAAK